MCINRQLGNRFGKSRTGPGPAISLMSHSSSPPILRVHFGARRFPFGGRVSWSTSAIISLGLHCCFFLFFFTSPQSIHAVPLPRYKVIPIGPGLGRHTRSAGTVNLLPVTPINGSQMNVLYYDHNRFKRAEKGLQIRNDGGRNSVRPNAVTVFFLSFFPLLMADRNPENRSVENVCYV